MSVPGRCEAFIAARDGAIDGPVLSVRMPPALAEPASLRCMPTRGRQ
jgi:hypothetical protein